MPARRSLSGAVRLLAPLVILTLIGALCAPPSAAAPDIGPVGAVAAPDGPARAWLIADMDSGAILAGKDPYGSFAPASTIKVLLAMVVLDHLSPAAAVRANANHTKVECSCVGLVPGQVYTTRQLLEGLLMVSGNDAANLLGDMLGGYRAAIARMTAKAQSLGARNTRALSPSGLDGPGWCGSTSPRSPRCCRTRSPGSSPAAARCSARRCASGVSAGLWIYHLFLGLVIGYMGLC